MIVRSIRVEGWRCFAAAVEAGPFEPGLNVLHAPNGSGKSTLFEAMVRGLLDQHAVSGRDVEALRPWGRTLAPQVTVHFDHGGVSYRIFKRFLDKPASELSRREGEAFVPLEQGAPADERVRAILSSGGPTRGLARAEHWGIAQALWAPQGELALEKPSSDIAAHVRATLGAEVTTGRTAAIERAIEALYGTFYAPTTGRLRAGQNAPPVVQVEQALRAADAAVKDATTRYEAYANASTRIVALREAGEKARAMAESLRRELDVARRRAQAHTTLLADRAEREERARASAAQARLLRSEVEQAQSVRNELAALRSRHDAYARELAAMDADERAAVTDALDAARRELTVMEQERGVLDAAEREAREAARYTEACATVSALARRLDETSVTLVFEPGTGVELLEGERVEGAAPVFRGAPEVRVRVAGAGIVRAIVPTGATSLDALRDARRMQQREHDEARARQQRIEDAWPAFRASPPDATALERAAREARAVFEPRERATRARCDAAERAVNALHSRTEIARARLDETARTLTTTEARLDAMARGGRTDRARDDELERALLDHEGAQARLRQIDADLQAAGPDPRAEVARLEDRLLAAEEQSRTALAEEKTEEGRLAHQSEAGPWSTLAQAIEAREVLARDLERARVQADAVKLLRTTVAASRAAVISAVSAPVERAATEIFHRIAGARLGGVHVGGAFEPAHVEPEGLVGAHVTLDRLSGGEREQVQLATRLALANVLARTERQLVVLDDVLVATDEARLSRVQRVLEDLATGSIQVLVLTCHPERWRDLRNARFVALARE